MSVLVVLDSSVIANGDWRLNSNQSQLVLAESEAGRLTLAIPLIVIQELCQKWHDEYAKSLRQTETVEQLLDADLLGELPDPATAAIGYEDALRARLKEARVDVLGYPNSTHQDLVMRSLAKAKPFDREGRRGYRDALIWESIRDALSAGSYDEFVLVTNNVRDFGADGGAGLDPDLEAELLADHPGLEMHLCRSIRAVVELLIEPVADAAAAFAQRLRTDSGYAKELAGQLASLADQGGTPFIGDLDGTHDLVLTDERIAFLDGALSPIEVVDARRLSANELVVTVKADVDAYVGAVVDLGDYARLPEDRRPVLLDRVDHNSLRVAFPIRVALGYDGLLDVQANELSSAALFMAARAVEA